MVVRGGAEVFARAPPELVEIEETFGFEQEISRNRSIEPGPHHPTGRITISLPYDGDQCFTRDALGDVEQHLKRRGPPEGEVKALIGHLILANYQHMNLSDPKVLELSGSHGKVPLLLPVRSPDLGDSQDLVGEANTWDYRVPALHINGGSTTTREDAQRDCLDAISFALEGDPSEVRL